MLLNNLFTAAAAIASLATVTRASDLPEIEIIGNKFFYSNNGSQFLIKGVAYQQNTENSTTSTFVDPLADGAACSRDIPYLRQLQTNVIRVYALNTSLDHSECMDLLQEAGIYVIADLSEPDLSINRDDPTWTLELYERYTSVVDLFHNYTNILGFFAGNEVTNEVSNTDASAYVKAAVRDTKAYIKAQGYRSIPVGYSANDDTDIRVDLADYFACGDDDVRAAFFGINMYEWCGASTYTTSGYSTITQAYKNLGIPLFFSEYGCNKVLPRKFQEVGTIYGSNMLDVWSGGIVYMYFQEENNYGLVSVSGNSVSTLSDFNNLKTQLASISPTLASAAQASSSSVSATSCPTVGSDWAASTELPPSPNSAVCDCMQKSLTCVVSDDVSSSDYGDLFAYVCGLISCESVNGNGTTGEYGAYSPCSDKQRMDFILNLYYEENGGSSDACDFSGSASTQSAATASSCTAYLLSAGSSGLGTVKASATATGTATGSSGSSGSSKSSGSSSSSGSLSSTSSSSKKSEGVAVGVSGGAKGLMVMLSMAVGAVFIAM